ncbi:Dbl homology domain-containing protein, partial [Saccharata proteae CBS 121410]
MKRSETPSSPPPRSSASKSHEGLRAPREELDPDTRKRLTQRRHVARELLDTEAAYYQDIKVVEDIYKGTSHSVADVTDDDRKVLFGNCEDIVSFSMKFTDSLKPAMASIYKLPKSQRWDSKRGSFSTPAGTPVDQPNGGMGPVSDLNDRRTFIGSVFLEHMADMERVYSYYAQNHGAANTRLIELQQRPHVRQWLTECNNYAGDITSAWSLDALIVKPTQRLLKYSMLIEGLIKTTPEDHPDRETLVAANAEMLALCARVNESKGQQELVEKVAGRGRKASDSKSLAAPFSKAFGRKLKQQIGLSETSVEDPDYDAISQKFGGHFFQLQIVMRDVEKYVDDVQAWMDQNILLATELDGWLDISQGSAPELESKWRKYAVTIRQVMQVCLTEHKAEVRQNVVQPIMTLWKYHERPQKLMNKRKKRLPEYSKYRNAKDCGAKPDKKTEEVALEFEAINASLKEDLPKLYAKTKTLIDACHKNLVWSQFTWYSSCYQKLQTVIDDVQSERTLKGGLDDVVSTFESDYRSVEAELERIETVMRNLKEMATFSPAATYSTDDFSMKRPSTFGSSKRTQSINSDQSVVIINTPDPSQRTSASFPALP